MEKYLAVQAIYRTYHGQEEPKGFSEEIAQLFEPKADEGGLLTDGEITAIVAKSNTPFGANISMSAFPALHNIAKAQRDLTTAAKDREMAVECANCDALMQAKNDAYIEYQAKLEQVFAEIEGNQRRVEILNNPKSERYVGMPVGDWQALKEKYLKEGVE